MYRKFLILLLVAFFIVPLSAQEGDSDLIAYFNEQLYILDGDALIEYDACMPDEEILGQFIPSPDNTQFLIATYPKIISEALDLIGSLGDAPIVPNYWLCDTTDDSLERIIVQPDADEPFSDFLPETEAIMGQVAWSPDGSQLAWTELDFIEGEQFIVIFDLETDEIIDYFIDVPLAPFPAPPDLVAWTDDGIAIWVFEFDDETFFNIETMYVFDTEIEDFVGEYEILNGGESADFYVQRELVQARGDLYYALEFQEEGWVLVDFATGDIIPTEGHLAWVSPNDPDALQLQFEVDFDYNYNWEIVDPVEGNNPDILRGYPPERITLSGDGSEVAYADATLHIYNQDGTVADISNSDGFADDFQARIIWGATVLSLIEPESEIVTLPDLVEVTEEASVESTEIVVEATEEVVVEVTEIAVEATEEVVVEVTEIVVEATEEVVVEVTEIAVEATPEPVATEAPTESTIVSCPSAPEIRMSIGDTGRIISETIPNRLRSLPSTDGEIVGELPGGSEFTVLDGPACGGVYTWFFVEYNGITGWTAEGTGQNYYIEPVTDLP
ncbi:MAG: hypothetical protein Phog2KO_19550 [Phototrophicaceae bacterium]